MSHITELDEFNFHPKIADAGGISLVFFSGPHCSSCHHLKNLLNKEYQQFSEHFSNFSAFEVKADKAAALVNEFGVFHLPSMYLYRNGDFHCELQAEAVPVKIIEAIDLALTIPAEEEP
jgi:thioredoxin-like negative regulator of GroEL